MKYAEILGLRFAYATNATMRHLFICTLLCILPIPVLAQTKGSDLFQELRPGA